MKGQRILISVLAVGLGLLLTLVVGLALAQGPDPQGSAARVQGSIPTTVSYQGRVTVEGEPFDGLGYFKFAIVDSLGDSPWCNDGSKTDGSEPGTAVSLKVVEGLFNVLLGDGSLMEELNADAFADPTTFLRVWFSPNGWDFVQLDDRPIAAVPYAFRVAAHDHWGETWGGSGPGLTLNSSDNDGLRITSAGDDGLEITSAKWGVYVNSVDTDGLFVNTAGRHGVNVASADDDGLRIYDAGSAPTHTFPIDAGLGNTKDGIDIAGAKDFGLWVGYAGKNGVVVHSAGRNGVRVESAGDDGVQVINAADNGVHVQSAGDDGVHIHTAGEDGVAVLFTGGHGVSVRVAGGHGLYVNESAGDGVHVKSAWNGVKIDSAWVHGVSISSTISAAIYVADAGTDGVHISSAGGDGFRVDSAYMDGLRVGSARSSGVAATGDEIGVYGHTTKANHEWGLKTPDKIYAGAGLASVGPLMFIAQNGDGRNLEAGDVVAVSGMGAPFADGDSPVPLVQKTGQANSTAVGVVYRRFVAEEKVEEVEHDGKVERRTSIRTNSTEGPIAPGDYLLIVVLGPAQVKADASLGSIRPGDLLTASDNGGQAMKAKPVKVSGVEFYLPGTVIGKAMEPLEEGNDVIWVMVTLQ